MLFDLDRTLLAGPPARCSGGAADRRVHVAGRPGRAVRLPHLQHDLETLPAMMLTRQAAGLAKGRSRQAMRQAGEAAAEALAGMIQPFAGPVFEQHRQAGRPIVLATTTPATWSSRSPTDSASTTSLPPGTASTPTALRRSVAGPSSGPPASWRQSAVGGGSTASISRRATPTWTASTTRRCSTPSARRSSSTPTRGW